MIRENIDRNFIIYELWKKGHTIDEISFDTGIPRSTVGYYIRKFNKRAKIGEPIVFLPEREKLDEKDLAITAFTKNIGFQGLMKMLREDTDGLDKVYKLLMCTKLLKELQRDIFPTIEESKALDKHRGYVFEQVLHAMGIFQSFKTR